MDMLLNSKKIIMDNGIAHLAATLRRNRKISLCDAVIAATALSHDAILATRNVKDFKNIPNLKIIEP